MHYLGSTMLEGVIKRASSAFVIAGIGAGLTFLIQLSLANFLGAEQFGIYAFVTSHVAFFVLVVLFGTDMGSQLFLPNYLAIRQHGLLKGYIRFSKAVLAAFSLLVVSIGFGILQWSNSHTIWIAAFIPGLVLIPVLAWQKLVASYTRGIQRVARAEWPLQIGKPLFFLLSIGLIAVLEVEGNAKHILFAELGISFLILIITLLLCKPLLRPLLRNTPAEYDLKTWTHETGALYIVALSQVILARADIIMLGSLCSPQEAGVYAVASVIAAMATFFINSANTVIAPKISELYTKNQKQELQRLITFSAQALFCLSIPIIIILASFGKTAIQLLFGTEFSESFLPMLILLIGHTTIVSFGSVGLLMTMSNQRKVATLIIAASAVLNIILNYFLIQQYSMVGAAIATSLSLAVRSLLLAVFAWRRLGIMPTCLAPLLLRAFGRNNEPS